MATKPSAKSSATRAPASININLTALAVSRRIMGAIKALELAPGQEADGKALSAVVAILREPAAKASKATAWQSLSSAFHALKGVEASDGATLRDGAEREYVRLVRMAYEEAVKARA